MALLDEVRAVCGRLAPHGWAELLGGHGLDIEAADLGAEPARPLTGTDRLVVLAREEGGPWRATT